MPLYQILIIWGKLIGNYPHINFRRFRARAQAWLLVTSCQASATSRPTTRHKSKRRTAALQLATLPLLLTWLIRANLSGTPPMRLLALDALLRATTVLGKWVCSWRRGG